MTTKPETPEPDAERDLDVEFSQEYQRFEEYERAHRDQDARTYGEGDEDDYEGLFIPDDPGEYENG